MQLLDYTSEKPEENLALDEALLLSAEARETGEVLRFWESPSYFVVLGAGGAVAKETNEKACSEDGIPILRRCSGGGTVLQGTGCLNYTLILHRDRPETHTIESTNRFILDHTICALAQLGITAEQLGASDLVSNGRKFSGNAQRRRKEWILFHGTILQNFNLDLITRYLQQPEKQPDYRQNRPHTEFVANLKIDALEFCSKLTTSWNALSTMPQIPEHQLRQLLKEKYSRADWHRSF